MVLTSGTAWMVRVGSTPLASAGAPALASLAGKAKPLRHTAGQPVLVYALQVDGAIQQGSAACWKQLR